MRTQPLPRLRVVSCGVGGLGATARLGRRRSPPARSSPRGRGTCGRKRGTTACGRSGGGTEMLKYRAIPRVLFETRTTQLCTVMIICYTKIIACAPVGAQSTPGNTRLPEVNGRKQIGQHSCGATDGAEASAADAALLSAFTLLAQSLLDFGGAAPARSGEGHGVRSMVQRVELLNISAEKLSVIVHRVAGWKRCRYKSAGAGTPQAAPPPTILLASSSYYDVCH